MRTGGRLVIAIDGKTARGAKDKTGKAPHLVAALAQGIGAVLGQVAVDAKSSEVPAVRDLLKAFPGLAAAVIIIDAMHMQHDTAQLIISRGVDSVMTVKANMPTHAITRGAIVAEPGHQPPAPGRSHQHRCRQPPSRSRSAANAQATSDRMSDFAVCLPTRRS